MMRNSMTQRLPFLDGNVCPLQSIVFWEAARLPSRITNNFNQIDMDKATAGYSCTRAFLLLMFPVSLRGKWSENRKPLLRKSKWGWMQILGNATHSIHPNINWNLQREWQINICLLFQLRNGSNYKKLDVNGIQPIWTFLTATLGRHAYKHEFAHYVFWSHGPGKHAVMAGWGSVVKYVPATIKQQ